MKKGHPKDKHDLGDSFFFVDFSLQPPDDVADESQHECLRTKKASPHGIGEYPPEKSDTFSTDGAAVDGKENGAQKKKIGEDAGQGDLVPKDHLKEKSEGKAENPEKLSVAQHGETMPTPYGENVFAPPSGTKTRTSLAWFKGTWGIISARLNPEVSVVT